MPRPLRPQFPGALYHVRSRGNRRGAIFVDDPDRRTFVSRLGYVVRRYGWECHSFCLMTTHYHLLVETPHPNIALGMQYLKSRYAEHFNARHSFSGHVFDGRYRSTLVETQSYYATLYRYIARNPVRAGICADPGEWPWSSYAAFIRGEPFTFVCSETVIERFGGLPALREFVESAPRDVAGRRTSGV